MVSTIEIENIEVAKSVDGLSDVVTALHWRVYVDTEKGRLSRCGIAHLGEPNPKLFTPLPDVTQEQALGWLSASVDGGVDALIASAEASLQKSKSYIAPPWGDEIN